MREGGRERVNVKSPFIPLYQGGKEARQLGSEAAKHSDNISFAQQTEKVYSPLTTHYSLCKKAAFTLAETLITLGIIGVVAAMTLPSLIQHYKKLEYSTRLKKFYSTMQDAIKFSEVDNGPISEWSKPEELRDENGTLIKQYDKAYAYYATYIKPYIKVLSEQSAASGDLIVYFLDGSSVSISIGNCVDFIFDANGANRKPNSYGKDCFDFLICPKTNNESYLGKNKYFGSYKEKLLLEKDRDYIKSLCQSNYLTCSTLLMLDGWEFKDDYPYKL